MKERKRQGAFFDLDGTWFRRQTTDYWFNAAARAGFVSADTTTELKRLTDLYHNRKIPYEVLNTFIVESVMKGEHLVGMGVDQVDRIAFGVVEKFGGHVHDFTERLSIVAAKCDATRVIITGSLHNVAEAFARSRGIEIVRATRYPSEQRVFCQGSLEEWVTRKGCAVKEIALQHDLDLDRSIAIGDTMSDASMLECVGHPICFNPTKELMDVAKRLANQWPCVFEKKSHFVVFRPNQSGELHEISLAEILPANFLHHLNE